MKNMFKIIGVVSLLLVFLTGCNKPIYNVTNNKINTKNESLDAVYKSIAEGATAANWEIKRTSKNEAIATTYVRVHIAKVKIHFDEEKYSIKYYRGVNLTYKPEEGTIHENYNKWIQMLELSIDSQFNEPSEIKEKS